ncbi:unnamed protein product [Hydatigera taeniaeformis]|uniref:Transposase n=1 Tax=Hydatigena taeniaeformis TaxID=6205 RepID=A0A0R3WLN7_HYDTA|nr:unnamed protein product [Hydatigera taeniaeformis]
MVDFDKRGMYADYDPMTHMATHYRVVSLGSHVMAAKRLPIFRLRKYVRERIVCDTLRVIMEIEMAFIKSANYDRTEFIFKGS